MMAAPTVVVSFSLDDAAVLTDYLRRLIADWPAGSQSWTWEQNAVQHCFNTLERAVDHERLSQ